MSQNNKLFIDENGNEIDIPLDGSLGLLATGYKGLMAWRAKRQHEGYDVVSIKKKEWEEFVAKEEQKRQFYANKRKEKQEQENKKKDK